MNTRQKLTLGIAAIFMVTLTIVGVTYAYFVTRVTGTITESAAFSTAQVGQVIYEDGNCTKVSSEGECTAKDVVTLTNILPGTVTYKSFRVTNGAATANITGQYTIYLETWANNGDAQFAHGSAGDITADDTTTDPQNPVYNVCYNSEAVQSTGNTIAGNVVSSTATAACFDDDEYNNIYVSLYKVTSANYANIGNNGVLTGTENDVLGTAVYGPVKAVAASGIVTTHATQDLGNAGDKVRTIPGDSTDYYVLKIDYRNNNANQNIENNAALNFKVSIK